MNKDLSLGSDNIFVHQPDIQNFLKDIDVEVVCLKPGNSFDANIKNKMQPVKAPSILELKSLKEKLSCEFYKYQDKDFIPEKLIKAVLARLEKIKDLKFSVCPKLIFLWGNNGIDIDINKGEVCKINIEDYNWPPSYMCVKAPPAYFGLMSDPKFRWQDIYLSLRATVSREPDIFNTFINIFLYSDIDNIRAGFETTLSINDERIVIVNPHNFKNFEINRFCPHNGADLKDAKIDENNQLICPRHSWVFNLDENGVCKTAQATIDAKEVVEATTLCESISVRLLKDK